MPSLQVVAAVASWPDAGSDHANSHHGCRNETQQVIFFMNFTPWVLIRVRSMNCSRFSCPNAPASLQCAPGIGNMLVTFITKCRVLARAIQPETACRPR